jgi:HEAT repeat protein
MTREQDLSDLRSTDWSTRVGAVRRLQSEPGSDVREALVAALRDADTAVIDAAAEALVHRAEPESIDALLAVLQLQDEDAEDADHVADVLREHKQTSGFAADVLRRAGE